MRRLTVRLMACPALLLVACLGTLHHDRDAERVALAAAPTLQMSPHDGRAGWLLRQEPGWIGAYRVEYGGREQDRAHTIVRVALFPDDASASAAFARLTPEFARKLWKTRMRDEPSEVRYTFAFTGDEVRTMEYPLRIDPRDADAEERDEELIVQLIAIRAGRAVMVIESIGIPREELPPVAAALVREAVSLPPPDQ